MESLLTDPGHYLVRVEIQEEELGKETLQKGEEVEQ